MEVSFSNEVKALRLGAGEVFHGEGILAITKGFIELNEGRISVESQVGQGTSFIAEFPLTNSACRRAGSNRAPLSG